MSKIYNVIDNATEHDELIGGSEIPILNANVTLKGGDTIKRGTLLSIGSDSTVVMTTTGQAADYILQYDVPATTETTIIGTVFTSGRFNREKIITASGDSVESHEQELRMKNIHFTSLK